MMIRSQREPFVPMNKKERRRLTLATILFFFATAFFRLSLWADMYYNDLNFEEIVFHLMVPLKGTDPDIVRDALIYTLPVAILLTAALTTLLILSRRTRWKWQLTLPKALRGRHRSAIRLLPRKNPQRIAFWLSLVFLIMTILVANNNFQVFAYVKAQMTDTTFIEEHYIDPENVALTFPEEKRNLIYIYLESVESTFADIESGGAFPANTIPELTRLAGEYTHFSNRDRLGGAQQVTGTGWTIAAMFSQSTGLPLKLPIGQNAMSQFDVFFPGVNAIGDILQEHGYQNMLMVGSDATFGGRRSFFEQHGGYRIKDYWTAIEDDRFPAGYRVWWGFEDVKLYKYAKDELLKLADTDQPFNFTMLTVDTHHEDGYRCPLCRNEHGEQYANVMNCASRQLTGFVEWIQDQPFYEQTTIIVIGDHQSMDRDFTENIAEDYVRTTYNVLINSVIEADPARTVNRQFTSLDLFPTTLASLGVSIEGDQLGLGVNLYSDQPTLLEQFGSEFSTRLADRSSFYNDHFIFID